MHPAPPSGAAATPPAPAPIALPDRGIHDTAPADTWTDGFLTGNGEYGAVVYGDPALEKTVLNHHRFVQPNGTRDLRPPVLADRLEAVRDRALAGDRAGASRDFAAGWELRWTQTFHPAYELRIATHGTPAPDTYRRVTDYRTGEVATAWTDRHGTWTRRTFVSRADRVVVHELRPAPTRTLDVTLHVHTALDDTPTPHGGDAPYTGTAFTTLADTDGASGWLHLRATYPGGLGAHGYEGVTRAVPTGGTLTADGPTLVVTGAERLTLLTCLERHDTPEEADGRTLHRRLAELTPDHGTLLARHTAIHTDLYDRSRLDLGVPAADRALPTTELIARQNAAPETVDPALLERLYDAGRYHFLSSSGILPPRLTGIWNGDRNPAWAGDFTTDANVNLQVAGGSMLDLTEAMEGYTDLVLGQLDHWRTNARNLYGARGLLAPTRTDGEYGHMLHFDGDAFPGQCWTGGADWLLQPLLELYEITGDLGFLRDRLGPALLELALFYEDFLTRTDDRGQVVFVPSFSMENAPAGTGHHLSINATGDVAAGRHALRAAVRAATALGLEQGAGEGVARWTALLDRLPDHRVNEDGALAEWSWPGLADHYDHRHIQHLYGVWPLDEINPEDRPDLVGPALKALDLRGDQNLSAHGSLHRALAAARLKDGPRVHHHLRKILGNDMLFRSLMTSHNPGRDIFNADASHAIPAVVAESVLHARPGILELLPAVPEQWGRGSLTGLRARGGIRVHRLEWNLADGTATADATAERTQDVTLICRRGLAAVTTTAPVTPSPLGAHARGLRLTAGRRTRIALTLTAPTT